MIYFDLSHPIHGGMKVHPYDNPVSLFQERFLDTHKFNGYRLETGLHIGTHIDSPLHFISDGKFISEFPFVQCCGKACLIDVRGKELIEYQQDYQNLISENDIVLLQTGYDRIYGTEEYYNTHPKIEIGFARLLAAKHVKILGMDMFGPDRYHPFEIHRFLLQNNILILENLRSLDVLNGIGNFEICAFPLNIHAEASPVRAVAIVNNNT